MTEEQKLYFMYGAIYATAKMLKEDLACYKDVNIRQIIKELLDGSK